MLAKRHHMLMAAAALTLGLFGTAANAADIFSLTSATFKDSTMMPKNAANSAANAPKNPNCVGENVSPQLSWSWRASGRYQELRTRASVILKAAAALWRQSLGRLWHSGFRHQLCPGRSLKTVR